MHITLETKPFAALETEALVTYAFEETDPLQGRLGRVLGSEERHRCRRRKYHVAEPGSSHGTTENA